MEESKQKAKLELISIGDASEYLGISVDTLRRWERKGRIEPLRSPGGHRYYKKDELDTLFGKKYIRDEPTVRTSKEKDQPITKEAIPELEKQEKVMSPQTPKITLPAWRAFKEEVEVVIESVSENKIQQGENILERPVREISIPENTRIQISKSDFVMSPNEAYFSQQNLSVLTPPSSQHVENAVSKPTPESMKEEKNNQKTKIFNNKKIIYISVSATAILFLIIWFLLWKNSQTLLSPIP